MAINEKHLLTSYEVSYRIAKNKMSFTVGGDLVLPAAISRKMVEILDEYKYANDIKKISLPTDIASNRIFDINMDQRV